MIFFTDYLSHVLLSVHSECFSKYDKKLFLYKLPTSALTAYISHTLMEDMYGCECLASLFHFKFALKKTKQKNQSKRNQFESRMFLQLLWPQLKVHISSSLF